MIEQSAEIKDLAFALHAAQSSVSGVAKDAVNPHFRNKYASLETVIDTAKPALQANGIAFTQAPGALVDGAIEITTMLLHTSGQWMRSTLHVPLGKRDAQGVGSAITYGCRYSLMAMLGLPPIDDDGEEASKPAPRHDPPRQEPARPAPKLVASGTGQSSSADHLISLIKASKTEEGLTGVTNTAANVQLYEALDVKDQDRVAAAVQDHRVMLLARNRA